jgi:hypothetical protein
MAISNDKDKPHLRSVTGQSLGGQSKPVKALPHHRRPKYTGTELRKALTAFDRQPFTDLLVEWFADSPSPEAIRELATKHPEKWVQAMASLSKMAGFSEKTETDVSITVNYKSMSDSQIEDRLRLLANRVGLPTERLLTIKTEPLFEDVPSEHSLPQSDPQSEDIQAPLEP